VRNPHQVDEIKRVADDVLLEKDLLGHRLRIADQQCTAR
jgi:hypothetical protein